MIHYRLQFSAQCTLLDMGEGEDLWHVPAIMYCLIKEFRVMDTAEYDIGKCLDTPI